MAFSPLLHGAALAPLAAVQATAPAVPPIINQTEETAPATTPETVPLNDTGRDIVLLVPLRERVPVGQVGIVIKPDDRVLISKADLANAIRRGVRPEIVTMVEAVPDEGGYLDPAQLAPHGIELNFDPTQLEFQARFDPLAFPERAIDLGIDRITGPIEPDESEPLSILLAYQGSWDWVLRGLDKGFRKPRVNFDLNGRLFRTIAVENQFTYDGNLNSPFSRFGSRAFYDVPSNALRFGLGDLYPESTPLQDQPDISGIGVSHFIETFQSDRAFTASAGQRLLLREPATVTILVNGTPARTLRLQPGSYNIQDLPLTGGANRVDLVIENDAGGRRTVSFDFFDDVSLLEPGIAEYDAKLGVRSDVDDRGRFYHEDEPMFSGFYRRGIGDQLTLGANAQASRDAIQAGGEATMGTSLGLFTLEASASHVKQVGSGAAVRLQYRTSFPMELLSGSRRINALVEYRTKDFGGIGGFPNNPYSLSVNARYFQPVTEQLSLGAGVDYRIGRGATPDTRAIRADASYRIRNGVLFTGTVGHDRRDGLLFGASLFWRIGARSLATARYDSRDNNSSISYYHSPDRLLDALAWGIEANRADGSGVGVNGVATYRTNRGDFEVAHREVFNNGSTGRKQVSSLRMRGAVGLAGGKLAIGRYLSNSFAIVSAHPTLEGAPVLIGSDIASEAEARTGPLGPALVSMGAYSRRSLYYAVPDAPVGYDFGSGLIELYPWLHGGHRVTVGSTANVSIVGTLLDRKGAPLALVAGLARPLDDPDATPIEIYTNRQGKIGASGLSPGQWLIEAGGYRYRVEISEDAGSLLDFDRLVPLAEGDVQ